MESWSFKATPRELQFMVVGIVLGVIGAVCARALGAPTEGVILATIMGGGALFVGFGIAR